MIAMYHDALLRLTWHLDLNEDDDDDDVVDYDDVFDDDDDDDEDDRDVSWCNAETDTAP